MAKRKQRGSSPAQSPEEQEQRNPVEQTPDVPEPGSLGEDMPPSPEEPSGAVSEPSEAELPPAAVSGPDIPADKIVVDRLEFVKMWKSFNMGYTRNYVQAMSLMAFGRLLGVQSRDEAIKLWEEAQVYLKEHNQ